MKNISEKNYYLITIVISAIIVLVSIAVVGALNLTTADGLSGLTPHLPEIVTVSPNSNPADSLDQIDIFAKEDSQ